jgi:putative ABC transport system permease protein
VVRELIFDDISAHQPDRLTRVATAITSDRYRDLQRSGVFQDLAFETGLGDLTWTIGRLTERAWQLSTSANFFNVLNIGGALGQLYSRHDEGRQVAIVSFGFWRKRLNSDPNIVGRILQFNGRLYTVLGVLPRDYRSIFGHGVSPEVYRLALPDVRNCHVFGRMRDGFTREQTRQALVGAAQNIDGPDFARQISILRPMAGLAAHATSERDDRRYFLFFVALLGAALLLAVVACFNVAGLLLARAVSRRRELAVRKALGANRFQLVRHLLAEGFVLVVIGAGAGLVIDALLRYRLSYVRWP